MLGFGRTPLAWKNLTHDPRRLLIAVSGVTFAVVLMFMERGFQQALFDSTVAMVRRFNADIVINSKSRYSLSASGRFPANKIPLAQSCEGVEAAYPIYIENYMAVIRKPDYPSRPIRVVGLDVRADLLGGDLAPALDKYRPLLLGPETAIIDTKSKKGIYRFDPSLPKPTDPMELFLADKSITLVGTFELGTDFANDGTVFMSLDNFAHYFPFRELPSHPLSTADLGLVICEESAESELVAKRLQTLLGENVDVRTRADFVDSEISFWDNSTPIGKVFFVGVLMGFIVGVLICYQVLFNDISDHMPEFATLMAMGYSSFYFISLVVREAVYLALFGFLPGVVISWALFHAISFATGLPTAHTLLNVLLVLVATIVMCIVSGLLAVRKLLGADPANLF
jgi:putative ABC transport system permease protein